MIENYTSVWTSFPFISYQQATNTKICTYERAIGDNATNVVRYTCDALEICCEGGKYGCCSPNPSKYYESWCFWVFVFGIALACYVLCWYCKKLEKERQTVRVNLGNEGNAPRILPYLRTTNANGVDHLLESLIQSYRNRLANQNLPGSDNSNQTLQVVDNKRGESPPKYADAIKMPKPASQERRSQRCVVVLRTEIGANNSIVDEEAIPTYEEAVKQA